MRSFHRWRRSFHRSRRSFSRICGNFTQGSGSCAAYQILSHLRICGSSCTRGNDSQPTRQIDQTIFQVAQIIVKDLLHLIRALIKVTLFFFFTMAFSAKSFLLFFRLPRPWVFIHFVHFVCRFLIISFLKIVFVCFALRWCILCRPPLMRSPGKEQVHLSYTVA